MTLEEALELITKLSARLVKLEARATLHERVTRHMAGGHRSMPAAARSYGLTPAGDEPEDPQET